MKITTFRVLVALAITGALLVTGCGGDSTKDTYKKEAQKAANAFKSSAEAGAAKAQSASTPEERLAALEELKKSVDTAASDFSNLKPPSDVKSDNDALIAVFKSLSSDITEVETAVKNNDQAAAQAVVPKLQADQAKAQEIIASLQKKLG
jgi:hypothetical protein